MSSSKEQPELVVTPMKAPEYMTILATHEVDENVKAESTTFEDIKTALDNASEYSDADKRRALESLSNGGVVHVRNKKFWKRQEPKYTEILFGYKVNKKSYSIVYRFTKLDGKTTKSSFAIKGGKPSEAVFHIMQLVADHQLLYPAAKVSTFRQSGVKM